jgi:hypothetical protein
MHEISIGGVLVSSLIPCLLTTIPIFWVVDYLLRRFGCYHFVWHKDLVRVALFLITYNLLFDLGI